MVGAADGRVVRLAFHVQWAVWYLETMDSEAVAEKTVSFVCNICGRPNRVPRSRIARETPACSCGSTMRWRSIVHALSLCLFGRSIPLCSFPTRKDITGIGLSDWEGYAGPLAERLSYRNTFLHTEPRVDIIDPPADLLGTLDFLISSDVFEHVRAPVSRAFDNAFALLKPGGWFVLTVPNGDLPETIEHYGDAHDLAIVELGGARRVVIMDEIGNFHIDPSPAFHGGAGENLEMRVFATADLLRHVRRAGFHSVELLRRPERRFGIGAVELPIIAQKPR